MSFRIFRQTRRFFDRVSDAKGYVIEGDCVIAIDSFHFMETLVHSAQSNTTMTIQNTKDSLLNLLGVESIVCDIINDGCTRITPHFTKLKNYAFLVLSCCILFANVCKTLNKFAIVSLKF